MSKSRKIGLFVLAGALGLASILSLPVPARAADSLYTMMYFNGFPVNAAINNIDNSGASTQINTISPNAFSINEDGTLKINRMDDGFVDSLHAKGIKVVPYLSNHWSSPTGNLALQNHVVLAQQVADAVKAYNFDGVNVDIENAKEDFKDTYTDFVRLLREKLPADKELSVAVAANPKGWVTGWHGSYDYKKLGEYADNLFIMAYDQNQASAGPVAGYDWVKQSIEYALKYVPANKLVLGIPLYGRIWSDNSAFSTTSIRLNLIPDFTAGVNASLSFDQGYQVPYGKFSVPEGNTTMKLSGKTLPAGNYEMWFEDTNSIQRKYMLAQSYGLKGVGFWAVGGEPVNFWSSYAHWQKGDLTTVGQSGWVQEDGAWKYMDNDYPLKGWQSISGDYYYFDTKTGIMRTSWLFTNRWYYLHPNGKMATGWLKDDNSWYLLNSKGAMQTGWQKKGGSWYLLGNNGKMLTGWQARNSRWYYMNNSGVMQTGWQKIDGNWYYMNSSGAMQTGSQRLNGKSYSFDSSGVWIP